MARPRLRVAASHPGPPPHRFPTDYSVTATCSPPVPEVIPPCPPRLVRVGPGPPLAARPARLGPEGAAQRPTDGRGRPHRDPLGDGVAPGLGGRAGPRAGRRGG